MNIKRGLCFSILSSMSLVFILTACGVAGTNTASVPQPKTAKVLLADSKTAMDKLKTDHSATSLTIGGLFAIAMGEAQGSTASGDASKAASLLITEKFNSDNLFPKQSQGDISADIMVGTQSIANSIKQVTTANAFYVQNAQGKWYALDEKAASDTTSNPFAQITALTSFDHLYAGIQEGKLVDHGMQKLKGVSLRHITTNMNPTGIQDEIKDSSSTSTSSSASGSQKMIDQIKTATVDVWIDEATSYVQRIDVKLVLKVDPSAQTSTSNSAGDPSALEMSADYTNFNKTVRIEAPQNSTPANTVQAAILGQ